MIKSYTLNLHNVTCQLQPNKSKGKKGEVGFIITYIYSKEENTDPKDCEIFPGYNRNPY